MIGERPGEMRTPMRRVRGLGSARSGTAHFWHQRLTAVALVVIVVGLMGRNHAAVVQILGSPLVAMLMLLFLASGAYHMWIGMQEIILDYVHDDLPKLTALMANTFFCICVAAASVYALLKLSFGV